MTKTAANPHAPIGVLVKTFPKLSETFILGELLGLERRGLTLLVFSLQRPSDQLLQTAITELRAPVSYIPGFQLNLMLPFLASHLRLLGRHPLRYLRTLGFVLQRPEPGAWLDFWQATWLARRLHQAGIAHLYGHFIDRPAGVAELVLCLSGISYSLSAHAKDIYLSAPEVLRRKLSGARFVVTCTEYNRRHLAGLNADSTPVIRLYHGIDLTHFKPGTRNAPITPPLILSVGRLREKKGFATLIRACAELHRTGLEFRCQIVGYGPDHAKLRRLIEDLGLVGTLELAGALAHTQLIERYRRAALFVLPCQVGSDGDRDGIPNVLLEAMALELPVISTSISGIPEAVEHGRNGLLVTPQQPAELAAAMRTLLTDPQRAAQLGRAARATVAQRFSNEINLQRLYQLLLSARAEALSDGKPAAVAGRLYG